MNSPISVKDLNDNKFVFTPNKKGGHTVIFTTEIPGYSPAMTEFVLTTRKMIMLDIKVIDNDGTKLDVPLVILIIGHQVGLAR